MVWIPFWAMSCGMYNFNYLDLLRFVLLEAWLAKKKKIKIKEIFSWRCVWNIIPNLVATCFCQEFKEKMEPMVTKFGILLIISRKVPRHGKLPTLLLLHKNWMSIKKKNQHQRKRKVNIFWQAHKAMEGVYIL